MPLFKQASKKPDIKKLVSASDIEGLSTACKHEDDKISINAAAGLAMLDADKALEPFTHALIMHDFTLPTQFKEAAATMHKPDTIVPWINMMRPKSDMLAITNTFDQRLKAARMLAGIGAPAIPQVVALFNAPHWTTRGFAVAVMVHMGEAARPALKEAAASTDPAVRWCATFALEHLSPKA